MAETTVYYRFLLRAYAALEWATTRAFDLVYDRELAVEEDTYRTKFGNGATPWNDLEYVALGLGTIDFTGLAAGYGLQWDGEKWVMVQSGSGGQVPTFIADGDSFRVLSDRQALFSNPITVEGELIVDGVLLEV